MIKIFVALILFGSMSTGASVPKLDPREEFPGGIGTTEDNSVQAFSHPLSGTRGQIRRDFSVGNSFFNSVWVSSPSSTTARDGLGPNYNAVSCSACHFKDGRGRGLPEVEGPIDISLLFRLRVKNGTREVIPHPTYGGQFQPQSIPGVLNEGDAVVSYKKLFSHYADGSIYELAQPIYNFVRLNFGPLGENTITSPRVAPQMIGLGLLEAISEVEIIKNEDPYDLDGDGISGRANRVFSVVDQALRLGRFGWKAGKPSLVEQNAAAFNGDIGITSPLFPAEECTTGQADCLAQMTTEDVPMDRLNLVTTYSRLLAPPKRRDFSSQKVQNGRDHFYKLGCTSCHTPSFTTGLSELENLSVQKIYPYTDLLLHDMGDALADDVEDYQNEDLATTREWRTPPLWGLGLVQTVNGHTRFMHDGRARDLTEAVLWHGGEGQKSKEAFTQLSKGEREELIEFLKSL